MSGIMLIALLLGGFGGFVLGIMLASPRYGYVGNIWGDLGGDSSEFRGYLIDFALGVGGAIIGLTIAALIVLYV